MGYILVNGVNMSGSEVEANPQAAATEQLTSLTIDGVTYELASGGSAPILELIYTEGTAGTYTFTADETARYMFIVSFSNSGSGSITLPSGVTPSINEYVGNNTRGFYVVVADLTAGDQVTLTNAVSSWTANCKIVFKVNIFNPTSYIEKDFKNDNEINFSGTSTGSGEGVVIGLCFAKQVNRSSIENFSEFSENVVCDGLLATNTIIRILQVDDITSFPTIQMYGYDGGGAGYIVLQ